MSLPPGLLPITRQLHAVLLLEIEHEIEIERMVSDERYARDVLLVCDACPQTVLPQLAMQYRSVWAPAEATAAAAAAAAAAADQAPDLAVPDSMARRAMAPDSRPVPAAEAGAPPPLPPAAAPQPAQPKPPASAWLQRWWARLGRR